MSSFTDQEILEVWEKGHLVPAIDKGGVDWREDDFGNPICFDYYGNRNSMYGWEIDHIISFSDGGTDDIFNLRPLQWEANVKRN